MAEDTLPVIPEPKKTLFIGHINVVNCVALSPDNQLVVSGSDDKTVRLWDVQTGIQIKCLKGDVSFVPYVAFSFDGKWIAAACRDENAIMLWDLETAKKDGRFSRWVAEIRGPPRPTRVIVHTDNIMSLAFSPTEPSIASGSINGEICIWDFRKDAHSLRTKIPGDGTVIYSLVYSRDGKKLLSGSADGVVKIWDIETRKEICHFNVNGQILSVAFSPNEERIVCGSTNKLIYIWDMATRVELWRSSSYNHRNAIHYVAFSPDGKFIISGSADHTVKIWDASLGHERKKMDLLGGLRCEVALSRDGRKLAITGCDDASIATPGYTFMILDFGSPNLGTLPPEEALLYI